MGVAEELRTLAGAWDEWGLGGKLTELAERLERQEVVSDEDAEAARWVREHGGVGFLEIHLPNLWSFIDHIMDRLGVDKSDIDGPELVDEELDRRLMPPGMEWPRFDDGEKLKLGDPIIDDDELPSWREVDSVTFQRIDGDCAVDIENVRGVCEHTGRASASSAPHPSSSQPTASRWRRGRRCGKSTVPGTRSRS